jgi:hypothetical protein
MEQFDVKFHSIKYHVMTRFSRNSTNLWVEWPLGALELLCIIVYGVRSIVHRATVGRPTSVFASKAYHSFSALYSYLLYDAHSTVTREIRVVVEFVYVFFL